MDYEVIVIGSGPAGYECALNLRKLGKSVAVVERSKLGGVCTNRGCIPTKALAASADAHKVIGDAQQFGIKVDGFKVDCDSVFKRRDRISKTMGAGIKKLLMDSGVYLIEGDASIIDKNSIRVGDILLSCIDLVIATGSVPTGVGNLVLDHEWVISGDDASQLDCLPENILVVGGGFIGCEYASIFSLLGSKVTLVEAQERLLPLEDPQISETLQKELSKRVDVIVGEKLEGINPAEKTVELGGKTLAFDMILLAVGRAPTIPDGLSVLGLELKKGGWIKIDGRCATNIENVWAAGDVTGDYLLAHTAYVHAEVIAKNINGLDASCDFSAVPWCVFTSPEIARVGALEGDSEGYLSATYSYLENGKARCQGERIGFCKIVFERDSKRIVGAHMIGSHCSDLIGEAALAISKKMSINDVVACIHPHPSLSEIFKSACIRCI